jgi:hypothetical protein
MVKNMEKKVYQVRYSIKDKETKRVKTRRIYNVMATDLKDVEDILREKWFMYEIEINDVLNEWSLEEYIRAEDKATLIYRGKKD